MECASLPFGRISEAPTASDTSEIVRICVAEPSVEFRACSPEFLVWFSLCEAHPTYPDDLIDTEIR